MWTGLLISDTGCCLVYLPGVMDNKIEWWERVKELFAISMTWWWWWYIYYCYYLHNPTRVSPTYLFIQDLYFVLSFEFYQLAEVVLCLLIKSLHCFDGHPLNFLLVKLFLYELLTLLALSLHIMWTNHLNLLDYFIDFIWYSNTTYIIYFNMIYARNSHYSPEAIIFKYT